MKRTAAVPIMVALLLLAAVLFIYAFKGAGGGTSTVTATPATKYPLHAAAAAGDLAALKAALDKGTDVNSALPAGGLGTPSRPGETALMIAARSGHPEVVAALLRAQATADARTEDGWTALMLAAAESGSPGAGAAMQTLIDAGSSVDARNEEGKTPLMLAAGGGIDRTLLLLGAGASVNAIDSDGATALGYAAASDSGAPVVRVLIEAGANVDAADVSGVTPMMRAAARDDVEVVMLLLDAGATVDSVDSAGRTALDWAKSLGAETKPKSLKVLAEAGGA